MSQSVPVVCFSYLAAAELWQVPRFPLANSGAEVLSVERSIAADAPMVAAVLAAFGVPTLLLTNDIGNEQKGREVHGWLQRYGVTTTAKVRTGTTTPQIAVVADNDATRTWFPHLPGVSNALAALDLSPLLSAPFAYVDCYQLIETAAIRAVEAARSANVPLLLNLGGSPLSSAVITAVRSYPRLIIQSNVNDAACEPAPRVADEVLTATGAAWAVITAGAAGAVAASKTKQLTTPAFRALVRHPHCAGAAFSAGLIYGLLNGWPMDDCLTLGCASGALRCERAHHEPLPTLAELHAVIGSRERTSRSAA
ncbi:MAG: carbohydrate kinase family protein [Streptosporangiaceae bacterium]|nr:carbohydrate kinase family protein [Streptosporangiaceae bacterium]